MIYKERIFNDELCHEQILANIVKAICSFANETQISDNGTIELSKSKISFVKIQDITYVLVHGLKEKQIADKLIGDISSIFEEKSRAKFHSEDPRQVFAGASAVFAEIVEELFKVVIEHYDRLKAERDSMPTPISEVLVDMELIDMPMQYDEIALVAKTMKKKEKTDKKDAEVKGEVSQEQKLSAVTFNILNSMEGIEHLVFVEHKENNTILRFQNGKLSEKIVNKTLGICQKFLEEILKIMKDEDSENAIEVSEKYQIIFVPLNEDNFMYAVATKVADPVLLQPIFERIANRIKNVVLEYEESK
ncbi:MAG: hypothetical protein H7641_11005 [Candidatus Heimdallarchaeota archaeon]|nr:hypothetical protein [Candidatus Heimdallarchaeota archaeon]MCK4878089.1 hypothetical protein [Candidatus Heimdallarchaeota archaeon]